MRWGMSLRAREDCLSEEKAGDRSGRLEEFHRPDRPNVRLSGLSCIVQMMTDQYEVSFVRLSFGEARDVDGVIAFGEFSDRELDFLRSLSFAIVFINSNQYSYEFDQVKVDFDAGHQQMVSYLLDREALYGNRLHRRTV